MSYRYPYGNTEQMNLDWFLNQWEKFKADWAEAEAGIDGSLNAEIAKVEAAMSELYAARDAAAASATAARQSSLDAAAAQVAAGNSKTAAQAAETAARGSQQAAAESAQEAQASAQGAENSALTASQAANTATQQAAGADAAKGAAEAAQQAAEDAQAAAAQSAGQAGQAATAAADHADDAADSATLAQQAAQDMTDSVEQITTNKNNISDLKESFTQFEDDVAETGVATTTNSSVGEPAKFVSPIKNPIITELYTTLPYSSTAYSTEARAFVQYNGNEATGRTTLNTGLTAEGEIIHNSSGSTLIGPIPVTENDTYFYMWWRKTSSSGRATRAFAYNENDIATTLWNENYSSKQPTREAEIPSGTKYIYAATMNEGDTIRASFRRSRNYITLPADFYGGKIDWIKKQIIQEYDASGNILDTPIITSILDFKINAYKGENNYYLAGVSLLYLPSGTTTITYKAFLEEESNAIKSIIAKTIQDMVADTALVENDFRIVDNTLYRITTNVASGATLIPNTNCEETTVTAVLKSLLF